MVGHEVWLAVATPAIAAATIFVGQKRLERVSGWIATASALISAFLILVIFDAVVQAHSSGGNPLTFEYSWIPQSNVGFGFLIDMLNLPIGLTATAVTALSCLYSVKYVEKEQNRRSYFALTLFILTGMLGVVFSIDLIQFYLFWELMLIPSYLLIARLGASRRRLDVGFKYFIFTHLGALLMLLGIIAMFSYTKTFNLAELPEKVELIPPDTATIIFTLLLSGFFVKMAVFPFHTWLPDTYSEAPIPVAAIFSGAMAPTATYGMVRVLMAAFSRQMIQASQYLLALAVVTILYGGLLALAQRDVKRLLAYSSISQAGYIIFGLATASALGIMGALLHTVNHAFCKALLFLSVGSESRQKGRENVGTTRGAMKRTPINGVAFSIAIFSLIGTPPFLGFWSKWMIIVGVITSGKLAFAFLGVVAMLVTAAYLLVLFCRMFSGRLPKTPNIVREPSLLLLTPIVVLASLSVLLGIWPSILLELILPVAEYLCP